MKNDNSLEPQIRLIRGLKEIPYYKAKLDTYKDVIDDLIQLKKDLNK